MSQVHASNEPLVGAPKVQIVHIQKRIAIDVLHFQSIDLHTSEGRARWAGPSVCSPHMRRVGSISKPSHQEVRQLLANRCEYAR